MRNNPGTQTVSAIMLLALFVQTACACGPFFPNRVLVGGDDAVLKAPEARFRAEIDRIKPPVPEHLNAVVPERKGYRQAAGDLYRQTAEKDIGDFREVMNHSERSVTKRERLVARYEQARTHILEYKHMHARWKEMRAVVERYERRGEPPPSYFVETWRRQGLDPESTTAPDYPKPPVPAGIPAEFAFYMEGAIHYHAGASAEARKRWTELLELPATERRYRSTWAAFMLGKTSLQEGEYAAAATHFRQVRNLAANGFRDSLGLASSSLGWEAMACMRRKKNVEAVALYLTQHATGDETALPSLQRASATVLEAGPLAEAAADETARKVVTAYLLSRGGPFRLSPPAEMTAKWLRAVETAGVKRMAEADRMAWAAYQLGDIETTEHWLDVADPDSSITRWIRTKILLRAGKIDEAVEQLRILARRFPPAAGETRDNYLRSRDGWQVADAPLQEHVRGELGSLLLTRREYVQALDVLLEGGHWEDAAYVAERLLTPDELEDHVDAAWSPGADMEDAPVEGRLYERDSPEWIRLNVRYLLARRLTRAGRWKEARAYYPPKWRPRLDAYIDAIRRGHRKELSARERAAAFWRAAHIARHEGMELLGYELQPDWLSCGGHFTRVPFPEQRDERKNAVLTRMTDEERKRAAENAPALDKRWHYRYTAADHAWRAVSLMPDDSDLTAKMLCVAGGWLKANDPDAADRFYKALVRRCGETTLGREADELRWFPKTKIDENALLEALADETDEP